MNLGIKVSIIFALFFNCAVFGKAPKVTAKYVTGKVEYRNLKKKSWKRLKIGVNLKVKDLIQTETESSTELALVNGSTLFIEENSQVQLVKLLNKMDVEVAHIKLHQGKLNFDINHVSSKTTDFTFETPTAVAAIRGTMGKIVTSSSSFGIMCTEGSIIVTSKKTKRSVILKPGNTAVQQSDGNLLLTSTEKESDGQNNFDAISEIILDTVSSSESGNSILEMINNGKLPGTTVDTVKSLDTTSSVDTNSTQKPISVESEKDSETRVDTASIVDTSSTLKEGSTEDGLEPETGLAKTMVQSEDSSRQILLTTISNPGGDKVFKQKITVGEKVKITAASREKWNNMFYMFERWSMTQGNQAVIENSSDNITSITVSDEDATIKAVYKKIQYRLSLSAEGGGLIMPNEPTLIDKGQDYEITATALPDFNFISWEIVSGDPYIKDIYSNKTTINLESSDAVINAKFSKELVKITILGQITGGTSTISSVKAEPETNVEISAEPQEGYYFEKWEITEGNAEIEKPTEATTSVMVKNNDIVIQPVFKKFLVISIYIEPKGMPRIFKEELQAKAGETVSLYADRGIESSGVKYEFEMWNLAAGEGSLITPDNSSAKIEIAGENVTVIAQYQKLLKTMVIESYDENGRKKTLDVKYR